MLSAQAIGEYQDIYKRKFGSEISADEAKAQGEKLLRVFRIIYQPIPNQIEMKTYEPEKI